VGQARSPRASPDTFGFCDVLGIAQSSGVSLEILSFASLAHPGRVSVQSGERTAGHLAITFQDSHKIHRLSQLDSITHTSPKGSSSPPCTDFAGSLPVALMRAVQTTFTSQVRNNSPYISEVPYLSTHTPSIHRFQPFDGCNACYIFASEYLQTLDLLLTHLDRTTSQVCRCPMFGAS
jgi:hypothetical protein